MPSENTSNLAWRHARVIVQLPEPPETFAYEETDLSWSELKQFNENGLIEKAEDSERGKNRAHRWQVTAHVYERAVEHLENSDTFDCCGSRGVTNENGQLKCIDCGEPVSSEEFRRVM